MVVKVNQYRCINCVGCVGVCPQNALDYIGKRIIPDTKLCTECGICVKFCPVSALSLPKKEVK